MNPQAFVQQPNQMLALQSETTVPESVTNLNLTPVHRNAVTFSIEMNRYSSTEIIFDSQNTLSFLKRIQPAL